MTDQSKINEEVIDFINQQLETLIEKIPTKLRSKLDLYLDENSFYHDNSTVEKLITSLASMLGSCSLDFSKLASESSLEKVFEALFEQGYVFGEDYAERLYDCIVALIAELEISILSGNIPSADSSTSNPESMDVDESVTPFNQTVVDADSTGRIAIQLDKICRLLKIDSSSANDSLDVISLIGSYIKNILDIHPCPDQILNPQTILPTTTSLTDAQRSIQQHLEEALHQDFSIRRQMMLTRFEVTLESLLGEEDDEDNVSDDETSRVRAAVRSQLKSINRVPSLYRWEDALQAPLAIFYEQSKKVTGEAYSSAGSVIKKVIVGPVPDRGGRVNELRKKSFFEDKRGGGGRHNFHKSKSTNDAKPASQGGHQGNRGPGGGGAGGGGGHSSNNNNRNNGGGGNNKGQQPNNSGNASAAGSGRVVTITKDDSGSKAQDEHQRKKGRR